MDIEIKKDKNSAQFSVCHEGVSIGEGEIDTDSKLRLYHIHENYSDRFFSFQLDDINKLNLKEIYLPINVKRFPISLNFGLLILSTSNNPSLYLALDTLKWSKSMSINHFLKYLDTHSKLTCSLDLKDEDSIYITVSFLDKFQDKNIGNLYYAVLEKFNKIVDDILDTSNYDHSIINSFNFPPEIQSPCEQYLMYFSRFLSDLGIDASTEIKSEAQKTLFTITPNNSDEALSKIRDALNVYLNLPQAKDLDLHVTNYTDVSVQQLVANIYHLKSQLMMANTSIQMKDAAIQMQQTTIDNLQIANYQLTAQTEVKNENKEEILGGLVTINEYKGKGFTINVPELFRLLKRKPE